MLISMNHPCLTLHYNANICFVAFTPNERFHDCYSLKLPDDCHQHAVS